MIGDLARRLADFQGASNRVRCFTHILNLVVKSMMHQFDVPAKWRRLSSHTEDVTRDLIDLAGDIEEEERMTEVEQEDTQDDSEEGPRHENDEGWIDERGNMIQAEIDELDETVRPVTVVLTKVRE